MGQSTTPPDRGQNGFVIVRLSHSFRKTKGWSRSQHAGMSSSYICQSWSLTELLAREWPGICSDGFKTLAKPTTSSKLRTFLHRNVMAGRVQEHLSCKYASSRHFHACARKAGKHFEPNLVLKDSQLFTHRLLDAFEDPRSLDLMELRPEVRKSCGRVSEMSLADLGLPLCGG